MRCRAWRARPPKTVVGGNDLQEPQERGWRGIFYLPKLERRKIDKISHKSWSGACLLCPTTA
eukprot:3287811-Pleurochrysis_carterae.AAC.1